MRTVYYVRIREHKKDECFYVDIPGFYNDGKGECITYGDNHDHALEMARECIEGLIESYLEHGENVPAQKGIDKAGLEPVALNERLSFVLWLRKQREKRGLSQNKAAAMIGMSTKNYQRIENPDRSNPTLLTLAKIRDGFGMSVIQI